MNSKTDIKLGVEATLIQTISRSMLNENGKLTSEYDEALRLLGQVIALDLDDFSVPEVVEMKLLTELLSRAFEVAYTRHYGRSLGKTEG